MLNLTTPPNPDKTYRYIAFSREEKIEDVHVMYGTQKEKRKNKDFGKILNNNNLLLQGKNVSHTSINGVSNPCLSFIGNCDNSLTSIMNWNMQQKFGHITSTKHLVNSCKSCRPLFCAKIRSKDTICCTLSPKEFACPARRPCTSGCSGASPRCHCRKRSKKE